MSAKETNFLLCSNAASPAGPPSVASGLKMSVQLAKPASLTGHLSEQ